MRNRFLLNKKIKQFHSDAAQTIINSHQPPFMLLGAAVFWGSVTVVIKASPLTHISPSKTLLYQLGVSAPILFLASVALGEGGIRDLSPVVTASLIYQIV